jgi:hypothetical protein
MVRPVLILILWYRKKVTHLEVVWTGVPVSIILSVSVRTDLLQHLLVFEAGF